MQIVPITLTEAKAFVAKHHRHNRATKFWKFGAGLDVDGEMVGVVMAMRPTAIALDKPLNIEVTRCCTIGTRNACSKLKGSP